MDEKSTAVKRVKTAIKALGRKHVTMLREAFDDKLAVRWFTWERQMLGGKTPVQFIEEEGVDRVREIVEFCYDFSTLPPDEVDEDLDRDEAELESVEVEED